MKSLGDSCLKFCCCEQRVLQKQRLICFSAIKVPFRNQETCYPRHQNVKDGTNLRISFKNKRARPFSAYQENAEIEEIQTVDSDLPKHVRVRFKLQRECAFGDQFLVVGNEPILGLWEPSQGLPLNWSEEHVWLGEVNLPSGKSINYKFVLKSKSGDITWQVGPDRVLQTWETNKVITVFDDWESPQPQNVVEEDHPLPIENEELSNTDGELNPSIALVADNVVEDTESQDSSSSSGDEGNAAFDEKDDYVKHAENVIEGDDDDDDDDDDVAVLVPGLESFTEENEENKIEVGKRIDDSLKAELKDENGRPASASSESSIEEERKGNNKKEHGEGSSIVEGDMKWGRRTLRKFLSRLGFP